MVSKGGVILLIAINTSRLLGQDNNYGIYKSPEDYTNGNFSCEVATASAGKIKLHHFFSGRYVDVIKNGEKCRFCKDSIFGYRNSKNEDFRFYKTYDEEYRILENKGIVIYLSFVIVSPYNAKRIELGAAYFFSKTIDSEILPLTLLNLKKAYPESLRFHDMLDVEFGGGEPLSAYSLPEKKYKLNIIFNKSNLK